jgi:mRNA interferase RelE/StbE
MMYHLSFSRRAEKEFLKLPISIAERITEVVSDLKTDPRPPSCVKLTGSESEYRIRIGDYRILYEISDKEQAVTVYRIRHRKEAYR